MGVGDSPHGASQTIFRPGISGVPDCRAMLCEIGSAAADGSDRTAARNSHDKAGIMHRVLQRTQRSTVQASLRSGGSGTASPGASGGAGIVDRKMVFAVFLAA